jgi:single-strand DNA-binding protein
MNQDKIPYLNKVTIVGAIVRDPELRHTTANVPVANFRIASSRRNGDNGGSGREEICYVGVVAWQDLAESCAEKLRKGDVVLIEGELKSRIRMDENRARRSYVEIRAHQIQFQNNMNERESLSDSEGAASGMADEEEIPESQVQTVSAMLSETDESNYNNFDYEENIL